MEKFLIFVLIAVMAAAVFGAPAEVEAQVEALPVEVEPQPVELEPLPVDLEQLPVQLEPGMFREFDAVVRMSRVTCDVLSWWGVNHSACALHCIWLGYKGGRCISGVCNCRN